MKEDSDEEYIPAVLRRPKVANHTVHESFTADTRDHEDHTFSGMMFDVQCKGPEEGGVPVECLVISTVAVRGDLGPLTVWTTKGSYQRKEHQQDKWDCLYEAEHPPSYEKYTPLRLRAPIRLLPGESCGLYVHSKLPGDDALVYDNQRAQVTHEDAVFRVLPGKAHLSNRPFGRQGMWGFPWRDRREFVGRICYGVRYVLWNPVTEIHQRFPPGFKQANLGQHISQSQQQCGRFSFVPGSRSLPSTGYTTKCCSIFSICANTIGSTAVLQSDCKRKCVMRNANRRHLDMMQGNMSSCGLRVRTAARRVKATAAT